MLCNQLLHFDDPEYTKDELLDILQWENYVKMRGKKTQIVCTSEFTQEYLMKNRVISKVEVIPQGHSMPISKQHLLQNVCLENNKKLRLVYASPSIDIQGDVHGGHINWDASVLLIEIWPRLQETGRFELHLVGKIGSNAEKILSDESGVKHGLVSISDCSAILQNCDIGLYPRVRDNFRQAKKISEYIGAGLAIVAFRLIDTSLVESLGVGISVDSIEDFVQAIQELEKDRDRLETLKFKSRESGSNLHWSSLAAKLDQISR
jgi:glycosyltransferase involved in cell wall biosynthesis